MGNTLSGNSEPAKNQLRIKIRTQRKTLSTAQTKTEFSQKIITEFLQNSKVKTAKKIATFIPTQHEPNISVLHQQLIKNGCALYAPKIKAQDLLWGDYFGNLNELELNGSILEPKTTRQENINFDLILVPALAIDIFGNRLGQGGGYFDRVLKQSQAFKVAVIFDTEFLTEKIPTQAHDESVDAVLTPSKFQLINI